MNIADNGRYTAFHYACIFGHSKIAEMILQKFSELNLKFELQPDGKDFLGLTLFHLVCKDGHVKVVDLLIQQSAELTIDINAKDYSGYTGDFF